MSVKNMCRISKNNISWKIVPLCLLKLRNCIANHFCLFLENSMFSVRMVKVIFISYAHWAAYVSWHKFGVRPGSWRVRLHERGAAGQRQEVPRLHSTLTQPSRQVEATVPFMFKGTVSSNGYDFCWHERIEIRKNNDAASFVIFLLLINDQKSAT